MGSETEPAKLLLPYLQRADELQKHEPLVAYYCRLYAMERGLQIPQKERTKTTNALLVSLMQQLERDKKSLKLSPDDNLYLEGFASNLFAKADKQDRAGRADLNTAKTFYAASIFYEILNQFGELQPDLEQKQKYAVWKAADIRKAVKEGRRPEPGPPGGDKDAMSSIDSTNSYDLAPSQSFLTREQSGVAPSKPVNMDLGPSQSFVASQRSVEAPSKPTEKPQFMEDLSRSASFAATHPGDHMPPQHTETFNAHVPTQSPYSSSSYASTDYSSNDAHKNPLNDRPEVSAYPQTYHQAPYTTEQQSIAPNYYSAEYPTPPYSYPNFQSYPSFHDSTSPAVPSRQTSFYQSTDTGAAAAAAAAYSPPPAPPSNYEQTTQYHSASEVASHINPTASPVERYKYDVNYKPPVETIAEAHKAARFAVGALAFDDVSVAVDHLQRALELLTNPSAEIH